MNELAVGEDNEALRLLEQIVARKLGETCPDMALEFLLTSVAGNSTASGEDISAIEVIATKGGD